MSTAYLALGSNLGDRLVYLQQAVKALEKTATISISAYSSLYETEPVGGVEQGAFLNAVLRVETTDTPETLLKKINQVEQALHRTREIHWGPRTIDIDILLFDQEKINTLNLTIPHKELTNRGFVLIPLKDVYLDHKLLGHPLDFWIEQAEDSTSVKLYKENWKEDQST